MLLTSLCHKLSHLLGPLERDVLYGQPLRYKVASLLFKSIT